MIFEEKCPFYVKRQITLKPSNKCDHQTWVLLWEFQVCLQQFVKPCEACPCLFPVLTTRFQLNMTLWSLCRINGTNDSNIRNDIEITGWWLDRPVKKKNTAEHLHKELNCTKTSWRLQGDKNSRYWCYNIVLHPNLSAIIYASQIITWSSRETTYSTSM